MFICFHYVVVVHDRSPNDPAVTPTPKKKPNSTRSLEPGGSEFTIVEIKIMKIQTVVR